MPYTEERGVRSYYDHDTPPEYASGAQVYGITDPITAKAASEAEPDTTFWGGTRTIPDHTAYWKGRCAILEADIADLEAQISQWHAMYQLARLNVVPPSSPTSDTANPKPKPEPKAFPAQALKGTRQQIGIITSI